MEASLKSQNYALIIFLAFTKISPTSQIQNHSGCSMRSCSQRRRGACMPPAVPWLHCRRGWWCAAVLSLSQPFPV